MLDKIIIINQNIFILFSWGPLCLNGIASIYQSRFKPSHIFERVVICTVFPVDCPFTCFLFVTFLWRFHFPSRYSSTILSSKPHRGHNGLPSGSASSSACLRMPIQAHCLHPITASKIDVICPPTGAGLGRYISQRGCRL
jgi:hypothetical protein